MTTRADVAKLAGVSESTVSYVLSGKRPISEATKKRVRDAIIQSGYKTNYAAATLAGGSPLLVTMMISNLFREPNSRIIGALVEGVVEGVSESGYHSVIWPVSDDDDSDIDLLIRSNISGGVILMNVSQNDQRVHLLSRENIPFVVLGRTEVGFKYNYVDRDFENRDRIALETLQTFGHSEVGVILYGKNFRPHLKKLSKALEINLHPISATNTYESGSELARTFKVKYPQVTGIITLLDLATLGFVETAKSWGLSIPQDVSVIGLNMLETQAESVVPQVTTISYEAFEIAKACGKMIVEVIKGGVSDSPREELWTGELKERQTLARARAI